jgi:hypothetical protein
METEEKSATATATVFITKTNCSVVQTQLYVPAT